MKRILCGALILCLVPLAALAKGKAGLWEISMTMDMAAQIPPEQLAQMKQMGIKIPGIGTPIVTRQCITKEQAESDQPPRTQREDSGCTASKPRITGGDTMASTVHCDGKLKGDGKVSVTYSSSEAYTGSWEFKGAEEHGMPVDMKSNFSGKWLGEDCGAVKPR